MRKIAMFLVLASLLFAPGVFAEEMAKSMPMGEMGKEGMMKMYQCPMDGYTSETPGECPLCGMKLEEKEMSADEAKKALEESKAATKE